MKKIAYILIGVIFTFTLLLPVSAAKANDTQNPLKIWFCNENGWFQVLEVHDDTTGVNYIVVSKDFSDGGVAICPRYNADGSLYIN